jgi:hypothetical protein
MKKVLATLVVLSVGSVASADLSVDIVYDGSPATGLHAWTVYFRGTDTAKDPLSAWDGAFTGDLHQVWIDFYGTWMDSIWPADPASKPEDSHLLVAEADAVVPPGQGPTEDFDQSKKVDKGMGMFWSEGTYFANTATTNFALGIAGTAQQLDLPFMQVVIKGMGLVNMKGLAVSNEGKGYNIDEDIQIPEPATLGLLAVGAAGALIRRRR